LNTIFNFKINLMIKRKPLRIKLKKIGGRTSCEFWVVLSHAKVHHFFKEILGKFNNRISGKIFRINFLRLGYWLNRGAIPSIKVKNLIGKYGTN